MKNFLRHKNIIFYIISISLLSIFSYRFYYIKWLGYERIPETTIFDERDYPFVGYTFRKTGVPTGWSMMGVYKSLSDHKQHKDISFNGTSITAANQLPSIKNKNIFNYPITYVTDVDIGKGKETITLVQPFFDHPIIGSYIFSLGIKSQVTTFDSIKPEEYRQVSLYLSLLTGILIFVFSYLLYKNYVVSALSFIIYSTVPTYVLMSRFALLENILIPLSLISFSFVLLFLKNKTKKRSFILLVLAGIFTGFGFLTKMSGVYIILTILLFLYKNKIKLINYLYFILPFLIISGLFYVYMYYLAPDLFLKLLFDQASRGFFGPLSFLFSILGPNFKYFPKESYWLFGIISLITIYNKDLKKHSYLLISFLTYLFVFLFLGGSNYPWYSIPFLPFLVIASGYFLFDLIANANIINLVVFYVLPFCSSFYWGYFVHRPETNNYLIFRLSIIFFLIIFFINQSLNFKFKIYNKNFILGKLIWTIAIILVFWQINKWNYQGFLYIISHWTRLPEIFTLSDKL